MNKRIYLSFLLLILVQSLLAEYKQQEISYGDALEIIENPHIGFYRPVGKHFRIEGNTQANTWGNLTHLRMDISEFSSNAIIGTNKETGEPIHGTSQPLSQDMLDTFEEMLNNVRQRGASTIIRFAYDANFNGAKNCDPDQSLILTHLKQLGSIYSRNTDVITYIELGMYGSWGEMHSSNNGTRENIAEALQTLLVSTPPEIKIGVRRPDIIACWLGVADGDNYSDFDIHSERFQQAVAAKKDTIYRVGMYNDGYLGSYSDLGTVGMGASGHQMTREMMVNWLNEYSQHTPYGGELVANYNGNHPINTPHYLSQEGFLTHTSYLNYEWHQPTILGWKDSTFYGNDKEYIGCDGFTYVANHLGYRFVLRNSILPESVSPGAELPIQLTIENVGFGNLCNKKEVTFILYDGINYHEIRSNTKVDPREWISTTKSEISTTITIPDEIETKKYQLFIRLSELGDYQTDKNLHTIRFGNSSSQYNPTVGANLIGEITVDNTPTSMDEVRLSDIHSNGGNLIVPACEEAIVYGLDGRIIFHRKTLSKEITISLGREEIVLVKIKINGVWRGERVIIRSASNAY